MKLIAGLGNIGNKYTFTRHNAGFMLLDSIALNSGLSFKENSRLKCLITNLRNGINDYVLIKPTTFMNLSGEAIRAVMDYYKISVQDLIIIYDDIALEMGKIRIRANGSDGGHNGIKSIIQHIGTNKFNRIKVGIGPQIGPSEHYVLQNFSKEQMEVLKEIIDKTIDAAKCLISEGIEKAQNKFN
jgi:PTH1 family peptidyl-tRNA hydrolase